MWGYHFTTFRHIKTCSAETKSMPFYWMLKLGIWLNFVKFTPIWIFHDTPTKVRTIIATLKYHPPYVNLTHHIRSKWYSHIVVLRYGCPLGNILAFSALLTFAFVLSKLSIPVKSYMNTWNLNMRYEIHFFNFLCRGEVQSNNLAYEANSVFGVWHFWAGRLIQNKIPKKHQFFF